MIRVIKPDWPAPDNIHACTTTRESGHSLPPYDSLNINVFVGDDPAHVATNRTQLRQDLALPSEPVWLKQVHGTLALPAESTAEYTEADATFTSTPGVVCVVQTADCLPVLLCTTTGSQVAAIHAGWKGLAAGVIEAAIEAMHANPSELLAWLGPAIGPQAFEAGSDVHDVFLDADPHARNAFTKINDNKWLADIYHLARQRLNKAGVTHIYGGEYCTVTDKKRFFSFRRDGTHSGRMATLIWIG